MARVILIEDDGLVRTMLMRNMLASGFTVTAMRDGRELDRVMNDAHADLLVIDLGLPYMDGFALVESLRAKGCTTPVLMISAYELPHLSDSARSAGANDLLQKPFEQEELIARMRHLLAA